MSFKLNGQGRVGGDNNNRRSFMEQGKNGTRPSSSNPGSGPREGEGQLFEMERRLLHVEKCMGIMERFLASQFSETFPTFELKMSLGFDSDADSDNNGSNGGGGYGYRRQRHDSTDGEDSYPRRPRKRRRRSFENRSSVDDDTEMEGPGVGRQRGFITGQNHVRSSQPPILFPQARTLPVTMESDSSSTSGSEHFDHGQGIGRMVSLRGLKSESEAFLKDEEEDEVNDSRDNSGMENTAAIHCGNYESGDEMVVMKSGRRVEFQEDEGNPNETLNVDPLATSTSQSESESEGVEGSEISDEEDWMEYNYDDDSEEENENDSEESNEKRYKTRAQVSGAGAGNQREENTSANRRVSAKATKDIKGLKLKSTGLPTGSRRCKCPRCGKEMLRNSLPRHWRGTSCITPSVTATASQQSANMMARRPSRSEPITVIPQPTTTEPLDGLNNRCRRVPCPRCGKMMNHTSLCRHLKYSCPCRPEGLHRTSTVRAALSPEDPVAGTSRNASYGLRGTRESREEMIRRVVRRARF